MECNLIPFVNTIEELDLEDYGVFNDSKKALSIMKEYKNSFIYACAKSGISENIINEMKAQNIYSFKDIRRMSKIYNMSFKIRVYKDLTRKYTKEIGNQNENTIILVLLNNHYMVNKKLWISPYYIRNREEIKSRIHKMKPSEMLRINRREFYHDGRFKRYKKSKKPFKIMNVIKELFKVNALAPIEQI